MNGAECLLTAGPTGNERTLVASNPYQMVTVSDEPRPFPVRQNTNEIISQKCDC